MLFRAERYERNAKARRASWALAWSLSPHVAKKDQSKVSPRAILSTAPGYDPDPEELS